MTRTNVIQAWLGAVALVVAAGIALGATITLGTGAMIAALCLVPPGIVLVLWPGGGPPTVAEVPHEVEGRR